MDKWLNLPKKIAIYLSLFLSVSSPLLAEAPPAKLSELAIETLALKQEIIDLNRKLYQFEENLLHPVETQVAVFLAVAPDTSFALDSIELKLDNTLISSYLYQEKEISALKRGGIQKLYVGSLEDGKHKLTASFNGQGGGSRYYRRKKAMPFVKKAKAKYIQLVVGEDKRTGEPLFKVKQW